MEREELSPIEEAIAIQDAVDASASTVASAQRASCGPVARVLGPWVLSFVASPSAFSQGFCNDWGEAEPPDAKCFLTRDDGNGVRRDDQPEVQRRESFDCVAHE